MSNAVKAKSWAPHFSLAYTTTGGPPVLEHKTVADGETIEKGMALTISGDEVSEAASTSGALFGIALADGVAEDVIPIAVACPENVFVGQVDADASSISLPLECDLVEVSNEHRVDFGSSTEDVFRVFAKVEGDDFDDTTDLPRVYFSIIRSQYDGRVAAR